MMNTTTIQKLLDKGLLQVQKTPAPVLAWLTMRLALLCVDLGQALADHLAGYPVPTPDLTQ